MAQKGKSVPQYTRELPIEQPFKIHIAIDFGTDGIGMLCEELHSSFLFERSSCMRHYPCVIHLALAYAVDGKVFVHTEWVSQKYAVSEKPKAILLLDGNLKPLKFGQDAKFQYVS